MYGNQEIERTSKETFASSQWVTRMNKKAAKYEYVNQEFRTGKKVQVTRETLFTCDWNKVVEDPVEKENYLDQLREKREEFEELKRIAAASEDSSKKSSSSTTRATATRQQQQQQDEDDEREWHKIAATIPKPKRVLRKDLDRITYKHELERVDRAIADYQRSNRELVKDMLESLDSILTTLVEQSPEYEAIMAKEKEKAGNALELRNLIISIADGVDINSGYSVIQGFVALRQTDNSEDGFTRARQKFLETVHQLQKIAPNELVEMLFNVVFINMLDFSNFPTVKDELGKSAKWPSFEDLGNQVARMWKFARQFPDGLRVNAAKTNDFTGPCHNCGAVGHRKLNCPKSQHRCGECGSYGHLERYCFKQQQTAEISEGIGRQNAQQQQKSVLRTNRSGPSSGRFAKPTATGGDRKSAPGSGGSNSNNRNFRGAASNGGSSSNGKLKVRMMADNEEFESEDNNFEDDGEEHDLVDDDEYYEDNDGFLQPCAIRIQHVEEVALSVSRMSTTRGSNQGDTIGGSIVTTKSALFVIDSGCIGAAHVCKDMRLLTNLRRASIRVQGYDGLESSVTSVGDIPGLGRCALIKDAPNNLVNLLRLLDDIGGGYYKGNGKTMDIFNCDGSLFVRATKQGGFLGFRLKDIQHRRNPLFSLYSSGSTSGGGNSIMVSSNVAQQLLPGSGPQQVDRLHAMGAQDRARAREAFQLCSLLGHPGIAKVKLTLEGPNLSTHLTSHDVDNAALLFGPCPACVEGKMQAPPAKASNTQSESYIGEKVYGDLLMYEDGVVGIGGYTGELFTVDGKTGFVCLVGIKSKHSVELVEGLKAIRGTYVSNHHRFDHIVFDDERSFNACRISLNNLGIRCSTTPAGLHNRVVESVIKQFKNRDNAILCSLPFAVPTNLILERHRHVADMMNSVCGKRSGGVTPYELFHHRKPFIPTFPWGQAGLFFHVKGKGKDGVRTSSEYGLFLGYKDHNPKNLSAFIPSTGRIASKRRMQALSFVPTEWNFPKRALSTFNQLANPRSFLDSSPNDDATSLPTHPIPSLLVGGEDSSEDDDDIQVVDDGQFHHFIRRPVATLPSVTPGSITAPTVPPKILPLVPTPTTTTSWTAAATPLLVAEAPVPLPPQEGGAKDDDLLRESVDETTVAQPVPTQEGARPPITPQEGAPVVEKQQPKKILGGGDVEVPKVGEDLSARGRKRTSYKSYAERRDKLISYSTKMEDGQLVVDLTFSREYSSDDPKLRELTRAALDKELRNFAVHKCFRGRLKKSLKRDNLWANVIPGHAVVDDQYNADGTFKQRKVRLVIGGNRQNKATIGETNSPTVNPISLFILLESVAGHLADNPRQRDKKNGGYVLSAYDFVSAFLTTEMIDHEERQIILHIRDRIVVKKLVEIIPELAEFINEDGSIFLDVLRWVYGLAESSRAFYLRILAILKKLGFRPTVNDPCVFTRETQDGIHYLCLHVDDVLSFAPSHRQRDRLKKELENEFQLKVQEEEKINYLGLVIHVDYVEKRINVVQSGYVEEILSKFQRDEGVSRVKRMVKSPAGQDLCSQDDDTMEKCNQKTYLSLIMSLMFLARMTRPDILMPVTYLATKCSDPTVGHLRRARRILRYVESTKEMGLSFSNKEDSSSMFPELEVYADASYLTHADGKGHTGILMTLGGCPIMARSTKQKSATRSSTEAELLALEEATTYVKWTREMMTELKLPVGGGEVLSPPTVVYQDNKSAIHLAAHPSKFSRTKHILGKLAYLRDRISHGDIQLVYLPTGNMLADLLTKPLAEKSIAHLCKKMGMIVVKPKAKVK